MLGDSPSLVGDVYEEVRELRVASKELRVASSGCKDDDGRDAIVPVLLALRVLGGLSIPNDANAMRASRASCLGSFESSIPLDSDRGCVL